MRSTFHGIETMRRALMANTMGMDVSAHNIANSGTPGFSRQEVRLKATAQMFYAAGGAIGTGVEIASIERRKSAFLEAQIRGETSVLKYWSSKGEIMEQVESLLSEPGGGLSVDLDRFWESWHELASYPESMAVRSSMREGAQALMGQLNHLYTGLSDWEQEIADTISDTVLQINMLADEIARVSRQIRTIQAGGDQPNDLLDSRDQLLRELSELISVRVSQDGQGNFYASVGGVHLVDGETARHLTVDFSGGAPVLSWDGLTDVEIHPARDQLAGLLAAHDYIGNTLKAGLEELAGAIITEVNQVHRNGLGLDGVTDRDFFDGTVPPGQWRVHADILADLSAIAASLGGEIGDGLNALAIAELQRERLVGDFTVDDYWRNIVVSLGVTTQEALRHRDNQSVLVQQIDYHQQSIAGVSLDEEMTKMVQMQHAYGAASRMITAMDEMLDTIISRMGIAGR